MTKVYDASPKKEGNALGAIGSVVGTVFGGPLGGMAGSKIGGIVDANKQQSNIEPVEAVNSNPLIRRQEFLKNGGY